MRLSIAALKYWSELGLQSVGGRKDVTAIAVCEPGDGMQRSARAFLRRTGEVYEVSTAPCRVGS